ncbi:flavin-dependent oxidoreductase [Rhizorhabdus wittichii DC-6]|nr:flavin-dependent oxidoreductase [Rhizorhabdus wittichii DC-6]
MNICTNAEERVARDPDIAIIGGGIVGLALAIGLHRRGVRATVYEAAPELREIGVGITLLPHAMRELAALGLADEIRACGVETRTSAFFNRFGQSIYSEPRGLAAGYAIPEVAIGRGRLHGLLHRKALSLLGPEHIRVDHQLAGFAQDEDGVTLRFRGDAGRSDRDPIRVAFAIGCDGVNSAVRQGLHPDDRVVFTGINTWRGVTRRPPILDGGTYMRIGSIRTGKMVIYPIEPVGADGTQLVNWVAEIERPTAARNDWNRSGRTADFEPIYAGWTYDWLDVPRLIRGAELLLEYPMVDKDPLARWTFGRVTLAGDAAHPMYPRGSNGSAQGLIDARVLADRIAAAADPRDGFAAYEEERRPPTSRIVETNRTSPPDIINIRVEELTGDRPFDDLDRFISQDELKRLSDRYKDIAGFSVEGLRVA